MVTEGVRIESLAEGRTHLAAGSAAESGCLVVPVREVVPGWLAELVDAAGAAGVAVVADAVGIEGASADQRAGWEIGVCTAALAAGVADVRNVAPQRVERVRAVLGSLGHAVEAAAPETAS